MRDLNTLQSLTAEIRDRELWRGTAAAEGHKKRSLPATPFSGGNRGGLFRRRFQTLSRQQLPFK